MSGRDPRAQATGGEVEPCRECGAPLAPDQRYCLNCGRRRGGARLDFRGQLSAGGAPASAPPGGRSAPAAPQAPGPPPEGKPQRDFTPLAAAGGIAVLGLMLLVGVLIGRGDGTASAPAPPQVVRVEGEGGGGKTASGEPGGKGGGLGLGAKSKSKGGKGGGGKAPSPAITASDAELKALQEQSPQEYSESSAKLPNEIATPGKAPPTDGKAPGGGGKGTAIE